MDSKELLKSRFSLKERSKTSLASTRSEDVLRQHYKIDGQIPTAITNALVSRSDVRSPKTPSLSIMTDSSPQDDYNAHVSSLLEDNDLTNHQREKLAVQILKGTYASRMSPKGRSVEERSQLLKDLHDLSKVVVHSRNRVYRPNFLQVRSSSVDVLPASPKKLIAEEQRRLKHLESHREGFQWAGKFLRTESRPEGFQVSSQSSTKREFPVVKDPRVVATTLKWKM
jgi:hypothetical protein